MEPGIEPTFPLDHGILNQLGIDVAEARYRHAQARLQTETLEALAFLELVDGGSPLGKAEKGYRVDPRVLAARRAEVEAARERDLAEMRRKAAVAAHWAALERRPAPDDENGCA
jgi:hypothetical protein